MASTTTSDQHPQVSGNVEGIGGHSRVAQGTLRTTKTLEASERLLFSRQEPWSQNKENILVAPYEYLSRQPGKNMRTRMICAFNEWLGVPQEKLQIISKFIGTLHTASLLIDDVEDNSVRRRGNPVAHEIYGAAHTINTANYKYFQAIEEILALKSSSALGICIEEILNLHRGQAMEIYWRDTLQCPSEEEYLEMIYNKTGGLFRLAIRLLHSESSCKIDCVPLANLIGIVFQITDDYLNIVQYGSQKGFCDDISEGKFSHPIIFAIQEDLSNPFLLSILRKRTKDEVTKGVAADYIRSIGGLEHSRWCNLALKQRAIELVTQIEHQLGESGKEGGESIRALLNGIDISY